MDGHVCVAAVSSWQLSLTFFLAYDYDVSGVSNVSALNLCLSYLFKDVLRY